MNIRQAKDEIIHTVKAYLMKDQYGRYEIPAVHQRPVLLIGPPGIGKTAIMEQIARECSIALVAYTITHHTRQSAIGLPFIIKQDYGGREFEITRYTMSEIVASIYDKMKASGMQEGILFIDEINCVSETLAPTMLQFLQEKTFGNHQIPEGWIIVAAGNPQEYNKSVREFDVVTLDRVKKIDVQPDYSVWKSYALQKGVHPAILSYLDLKKENFFDMETTAMGREIVTARGWEDLSRIMYSYEKLDIPVNEGVILQYIQNPRIARDFSNYFDLYLKYRRDYRIDDLLKGRGTDAAAQRLKKAAFDEKLRMISILVSRLSASFTEYYREDIFMREIFNALKKIKGEMQQAPSLAGLLEEQARALHQTLELDREKKILGEDRTLALLRAVRELEELRRSLLEQKDAAADEQFDQLRGRFSAIKAGRDALQKEAASGLENIFHLLEKAFGESQEMVMFLTGLNAGESCVRFIRDFGSASYDRYNRSLLFNKERSGILQEIDGLLPENQ